MSNGEKEEAVKLFKYGKNNDYTGAIIIDDGCFVVCTPVIKDGVETVYRWSDHIFPEAFKALKELDEELLCIHKLLKITDNQWQCMKCGEIQ